MNRLVLVIYLQLACIFNVYADACNVSRTIPVLYVITDGNKKITSREHYISGSYWIESADAAEQVGSIDSPLPLQIRGRGNSSWTQSDKKPYKIKLPQRTELLGMPANKHWALLQFQVGAVAGFALGEIFEMAWTPRYRPVELVLNGENRGLYFLFETVRIDENRVDIFEQADGETDPELIESGWLVEIDNYLESNQVRMDEGGAMRLRVTYHSPEVLSAVQKSWLKTEFRDITDAIYCTDKESSQWEDFIDVESMAKYFIIQELLDNPDGFHGSFYLHKDFGHDSKWVAGPLWDLDSWKRVKTDYTFRMKVGYKMTPHWIGELLKYERFCAEVRRIWNDVYPGLVADVNERVDNVVLPLQGALDYNYLIWGGSSSAQALANTMKRVIERNAEWFNEHLPNHVNEQTEHPYRVFNLQGVFMGEFPNKRDALQQLSRGIYVFNRELIHINK